MNKSKTVEYLKGMKFMQRKEEVKRREMFEIKRREGLNEALGIANSDAVKGPTILRDSQFPTIQYRLSRQSFLVKEAPTNASLPEGAAVDTVLNECEDSTLNQKEGYSDLVWGEDTEYSPEESDPTAVEPPPDRFYLSQSSRAPPVPKNLKKKVKKRSREE